VLYLFLVGNNKNNRGENKMKEITALNFTVQTQTVEGNHFQITTIEATISAFCDCCDNRATGTKAELEARGWHCGNREQFCPECN